MSKKRKAKRARKKVAQFPASSKVANEERPELVRKCGLWWKMFKKSPVACVSFVIGIGASFALRSTYEELAPRLCWYVGGFAPRVGWIIFLLGAIIFSAFVGYFRPRFAKFAAILALVVVPYLLAVGAVRLWYPSDVRSILMAALDGTKTAAQHPVFFVDYETQGLSSISHMINLYYRDENNSPYPWMPGASGDDILRIQLALDALEKRGLMEQTEGGERSEVVIDTETRKSVLRSIEYRPTAKGLEFYSRFFWTRRFPRLSFFTKPEYFEPMQGSDPELAELQKLRVTIFPNPALKAPSEESSENGSPIERDQSATQ